MSEEWFWHIIDESRLAAGGSQTLQEQLLKEKLDALSDSELVQFVALKDSLMARAYRWDLWSAHFLYRNYTSDDTFGDFRAGLIMQGKYVYERVLATPDDLADVPVFKDSEVFWGLGYEEIDNRGSSVSEKFDLVSERFSSDEPIGTKQDLNDRELMEKLYPRLFARLFRKLEEARKAGQTGYKGFISFSD